MWLGVAAFAALVVALMTRVVLLRRRGIKAVVFGATDKSDFLLLPLVVLVVYGFLATTFGWPWFTALQQTFWRSPALGWFGLALNVAAIGGLVWTLISFGASFRVGIDETHPGGLVTTGAFAVSRNPIYVCFLGFMCGSWFIFPSIFALLAWFGFAGLIHRQVMREERFLAHEYGNAYQNYRAATPRYL